jgi:hypothetical protein
MREEDAFLVGCSVQGVYEIFRIIVYSRIYPPPQKKKLLPVIIRLFFLFSEPCKFIVGYHVPAIAFADFGNRKDKSIKEN